MVQTFGVVKLMLLSVVNVRDYSVVPPPGQTTTPIVIRRGRGDIVITTRAIGTVVACGFGTLNANGNFDFSSSSERL